MLQKYNLAFIPSKNPQQFIDYAEALSKGALPDKYLLGARSIPHVSLCHFEIEKGRIKSIWDKVSTLKLPSLQLTFTQQRSKTYKNHPKWGGVSWISLLPDHQAQLMEIHLNIAAIIKTPLNASFAEYDPHLTLFNSQTEKSAEMPPLNSPLTDEFNIALGIIDEVGQVTEILFSSKNKC